DAYLRVGGLDEGLWYTQDWDLYLKLAGIGKVYYNPLPLACFRIHKDSLTVSGSKTRSDFRQQHEIVLRRHLEKLDVESRSPVLRVGLTSIDVNVALAAAMRGEYSELLRSLFSVVTLGPRGIWQYFVFSRILDRVLPRLRALAAGSF